MQRLQRARQRSLVVLIDGWETECEAVLSEQAPTKREEPFESSCHDEREIRRQ
jgi:hypothetical protein